MAAKKVTIDQLRQILLSWVSLNEGLMGLDEDGIIRLLGVERDDRNRRSFVLRIQQRYNRLRTTREREAIAHLVPLQRRPRGGKKP